MNNMDQLTEQYKEKFPHLKSYTECVSRTFISGLAATFISKYCLLIIRPELGNVYLAIASIVMN